MLFNTRGQLEGKRMTETNAVLLQKLSLNSTASSLCQSSSHRRIATMRAPSGTANEIAVTLWKVCIQVAASWNVQFKQRHTQPILDFHALHLPAVSCWLELCFAPKSETSTAWAGAIHSQRTKHQVINSCGYSKSRTCTYDMHSHRLFSLRGKAAYKHQLWNGNWQGIESVFSIVAN